SPVSWSHHWVWLTIAIPVLFYRALTWRNLNWVSGIMVSILGLWSLLVLTIPPKWYWGDNINVWEQELVFKVVMSDFVWLALATMAVTAFMLRFVPQNAQSKPTAVQHISLSFLHGAFFTGRAPSLRTRSAILRSNPGFPPRTVDIHAQLLLWIARRFG